MRWCRSSDIDGLRELVATGWVRSDRPAVPVPDSNGAAWDHEYVPSPGPTASLAPLVGLLVGGKSTRMGSDKATTDFGGMPMAARVCEAVDRTGMDTVVLGPSDAGTNRRFLADADVGGLGPMVGLRTLHRHHPNRDIVLLATDQPLVRPATLLHLVLCSTAAVVVPEHEGHPQVTCALYRHEAVAEAVEGSVARLRDLASSPSSHRVVPETWRTWGEDGRSFLSLDRPEDVREAEALLPPPQR